ncbi:type II secretion system F family protein [Myxococcota bacterium]|nr:type II secretion system F family protein [Myxococcota bacterium]
MFGLPIEVVVAVLAAVAVLGMGVGVFVFVNPSRSAKDRLEDLTGGGASELAGPAPISANTPSQMSAISQALNKVAAPTDEEEADALRRTLVQAGYRQRNNVQMFSAIRASLAVLLPTIFALVPSEASMLNAVLVALLLAAAGYYLPGILVTNALTKRQEALLRSFPDVMDMLVASVEAGLGLDAALRRVSDEMGDSAPELSAELKLVNNEIAAGVPRTEALGRLGYRTGLEEITSLVNVLVQAERFGTPIARSMRLHSELVRTKRMQRAEENAAKISPKLTVAMILFMLPCLIIILIGPAIVRVVRQLLPAMGG